MENLVRNTDEFNVNGKLVVIEYDFNGDGDGDSDSDWVCVVNR